jgi:mannose-6-phosphate isomerase-like protein (cupin superfamily)
MESLSHLFHHIIDKRPWGEFEQFTLNEPTTVKIITVLPDQAFSLQRHHNRDEFWKIISGDGLITIEDVTQPIELGRVYEIPRGTIHRITGGSSPVIFLEVAFGVFDENDIERLEDNYGRETPSTI